MSGCGLLVVGVANEIPSTAVTGQSKGYAFVEFSHTDEAEKAYHVSVSLSQKIQNWCALAAANFVAIFQKFLCYCAVFCRGVTG